MNDSTTLIKMEVIPLVMFFTIKGCKNLEVRKIMAIIITEWIMVLEM